MGLVSHTMNETMAGSGIITAMLEFPKKTAFMRFFNV